MRLDRVARQIVLDNIQAAVGQGKRWLTGELRSLGPDVSLAGFLEHAGIEPVELYDGKQLSFTDLKHTTFHGRPLDRERRRQFARLAALLHGGDDDRLSAFQDALHGRTPRSERGRRLRLMFASAFFDRSPVADWGESLGGLLSDAPFASELGEFLEVLDERRREPTRPWEPAGDVPLSLHARYRREEVLTAFKIIRNGKVPRVQAGVLYDEVHDTDLLFVTLNKTEKGFSPKTMYRDHPVSRWLFHWESQHTAHPGTATGRRYIAGSSRVLLFVRMERKLPNGLAEPFLFLGPVRLRSHKGARPMQIEWELEREMPAWLYERGAVLGR